MPIWQGRGGAAIFWQPFVSLTAGEPRTFFVKTNLFYGIRQKTDSDARTKAGWHVPQGPPRWSGRRYASIG